MTAAALFFLTGLVLLVLAARQPVTILVDGETQVIRTFALSTEGALEAAGITVGAFDRVQPPMEERIGRPRVVTIERAAEIWIEDVVYDDRVSISSAERIPANLLAEAGIPLFPADLIWWNEVMLPPDHALPPAASHTLLFQPALPLAFIDLDSGEVQTIYSTAETVGEVLEEAGVQVGDNDSLSIALDTALDGPRSLVYQRARPLQIEVGEQVIEASSAAATVGQALAENGLALQGMDYSIPSESQPLPADGVLQVMRVREEIVLDETLLPFDIERQPDHQRDAGEEFILEPGVEGLQVTRYRLRFENDEQISRQQEAQWIAQEAQNQVVSYGTRTHIASDPGIEGMEYWTTKTMYATSYYPCGFLNRCSYITASGATLQKGIIALTVEWYRELKGTQVYVPGYGIGTIADTGGGIPGKDWIDLGYGNEDYVPWSKNVTVYFLGAPPDTIPWFLQ